MAASVGHIFAQASWLLLLGVLAVSDAKSFRLPLSANLALAATGLLAGGAAFGTVFFDRLIGVGAGFLGLQAVAIGYRALRGRTGIGGGDPIMLGGVGAWTGWQILPLIVFFAALIGLLAVALSIITGRTESFSRLQKMPFGTLLAISASGIMLWPQLANFPILT